MDKCPKCGEGVLRDEGGRVKLRCGSEDAYFSPHPDFNSHFWQSNECRLRVEFAALRTQHERLVEAAMKAANQYSCELVEDCDCLMCSLYKIVKEEQALESEAKQ